MPDMARMILDIDQGLKDSDARIQTEIAEYFDLYPDEIGRQIAEHGEARIPTFAGDYFITEAQLREIAQGPGSPEAPAEADHLAKAIGVRADSAPNPKPHRG